MPNLQVVNPPQCMRFRLSDLSYSSHKHSPRALRLVLQTGVSGHALRSWYRGSMLDYCEVACSLVVGAPTVANQVGRSVLPFFNPMVRYGARSNVSAWEHALLHLTQNESQVGGVVIWQRRRYARILALAGGLFLWWYDCHTMPSFAILHSGCGWLLSHFLFDGTECVYMCMCVRV